MLVIVLACLFCQLYLYNSAENHHDESDQYIGALHNFQAPTEAAHSKFKACESHRKTLSEVLLAFHPTLSTRFMTPLGQQHSKALHPPAMSTHFMTPLGQQYAKASHPHLRRDHAGRRHSRHRVPNMVMEKFTSMAIKIIQMGQQEARRLHHSNTNEAMILAALLDTWDGRKWMQRFGLTGAMVSRALEEVVGIGDAEPVDPSISKVYIETVVREATNVRSRFVDTIHLLLATTAEQSVKSRELYQKLGLNVEEVRGMIIHEIEQEKKQETVGAGRDGAAPGAGDETALEKFTTDLTKKAAEGKLDPVIGREAEVKRAIQILSRRKKNNPVFVGEPGVGKTAVAEGLAQRIVDGTVPSGLKDKRILELDLPGLLAGTKYRGEFEERLGNIINETVNSDGNIILMIDEIHTLVGAGGSEGAVDASNIMKPKLASGELQVMGATTRDEYRRYIEKDKALERRFCGIDVSEPTVGQTVEILQGLAQKYEEYHGVLYTPEAVVASAKLSDRYIADRFLPDKAIDVLDQTGAVMKVNADAWGDEERKINDDIIVVSEDDVQSMVSRVTGIPVNRLSSNESSRLMDLEHILHNRVVGQDEAISAVAKAVRRARSGFKDPNRPVASFIFAGPTGVGKTELCKALANSCYASEKDLLRFDMSEFMEKQSVSKLVGSPPGYVGYDDESQLCDRIRRNPYSLVLFDEIEKAHPDIFNIMLQILDDGRLTDSKGRMVSFKHAMVILTSNVGAQQIEQTIEGGGGFGFSNTQNDADNTYDSLKKTLMEQLKGKFRPEFINRLDDTIVFRPLSRDQVQQIAELEFQKVFKRVAEAHNATITLTNKFKDLVLEEGFDPKFGARPLRRAVSRLLEDELSNAVLSGSLRSGDIAKVDVDEDGQVVLVRQTLADIKNELEATRIR